MPNRIGSILVKNQIITDDELNKAIRYHKEKDILIGEALLEIGIITYEQLIFALNSQLNKNKDFIKNNLNFSGLAPLFRQILSNNINKFIFISFLMILASIITIAFPVCVGFFIDSILASGDKDLLTKLCIILIIILLLKNKILFIANYYLLEIQFKFSNILKLNILSHINNLSFTILANIKKGDLLNRITNNIDNLERLLNIIITSFLKNIPQFLLLTFYLFYNDYRLSLMIIPLVFVGIYIPTKISALANPHLAIKPKIIGNISAFLREHITNIELIKVNNTNKQIEKKFMSLVKKYFKNDFKIWTAWNFSFNSKITINNILIPAIIVLIGGSQVIHNKITLGQLISYYLLVHFFIPGIHELSNLVRTLPELRFEWHRINDILKLNRFYSTNNRSSVSNIRTVHIDCIELKDVTFSYQNKEIEYNVFQKSNIILKKNCYGLYGKSGTGKTTFFNLLLGFLKTNKGEILFNNTNINYFSTFEINKSIAYLPQEPYLFNTSIYNNIKYGANSFNKNIPKDKIIDVAKKAGIHEYILNLENGYETIINDDTFQLSPGQKQRIALARALLKEPSVFIFDEPTASLDHINKTKIIKSILNLRNNYTIIIASHDPDLLSKLNQLIYIQDKNVKLISKKNIKKLINSKLNKHEK